MPLSRILLALCLLAAGCASRDATWVERHAPGRPASMLEDCLGWPTKTGVVAGYEKGVAPTTILEWDFTENTTSSNSLASPTGTTLDAFLIPFTLPLTLAASAILPSTDLQCRVVAGVQGGWTTSLVLAGNTYGFSGENAGCDPITRGCFDLWGSG